MHYADYWRKHSDVSLTTHVEGPQLLRTRGLHGIQFVFDWTPTEAETKQKKHKQNE
jgi:hypothetical protein